MTGRYHARIAHVIALKLDICMLLEVIDTGLLAWVLPLSASVLLFGIYSVIKTETRLGRHSRLPRQIIKQP